ncbi:MAG: N-acetylmuramidase [Burkholderiales bacterium]|nr:N-acetylmuramidase [Burkholderiales bacterium]
MASFDAFFPTLLKSEGGFVDDPADPGGATNKGVTMATFQNCAKKYLGIEPTLDNLKALTDAQAGQIYKPLYWDKVRGDVIALQDLADIVFDFQVNAGANASRLLQNVINDLGAQPPLAVDGSIGPGTLAALGKVDQTAVYRRYKQGRIAYYRNLVARRPSLGKFLNGWINRVNAFPDL